MPRLTVIRDRVLSEARTAWGRDEFRKSVMVAAGLLLTVQFLVRLPLLDGQPIVDVAGGSVRVVSAMLDAVGAVHHLGDDRLTIVRPGVTMSVASFGRVGVLLSLVLMATLGYAAISCLSFQRTIGLLTSSLVVVLMTNLAVMPLAVLAFGAIGVNLGSIPARFLGFWLRVAVAGGLLFCLVRVVNPGILYWRGRESRYAFGELDDSGEMLLTTVPPDRRRELSVVVGLVVCVLGLWLAGLSVSPETLVTSYRLIAENALTDGDAETAAVAIERLLSIDAGESRHRFYQAQLAEWQGDVKRAESIVRRIVASDVRGFAPAHRWLNNYLSAQRENIANVNSTASADPHDTQAVSRLQESTVFDPEDVNAHIALAEAYLARRSPKQAVREFAQVVDARPDLRLTLARLHVIAGEPAKGRLHGELARDYYQRELDQYPLADNARL